MAYGILYSIPKLEDKINNNPSIPIGIVSSQPGAGHFQEIKAITRSMGERNIILLRRKPGEYGAICKITANNTPIV